jgi:hypothetical protein
MLISNPPFKNPSSLNLISKTKRSEKTKRDPKGLGLLKKTISSKNSSNLKDPRNGHSYPHTSIKDAENNAVKDGTIILETESKKETGVMKNSGSFSWESTHTVKDGPSFPNFFKEGRKTP